MAGLALCRLRGIRQFSCAFLARVRNKPCSSTLFWCTYSKAVPQKHLRNVFAWSPRDEQLLQGSRTIRLQPQPVDQQSLAIRLMSTQSQNSFIKDLMSSPTPALCFGFAGAIPFCSLAALSISAPAYMDIIVQAQCAYGATILSFLGAIHWGYALAEGSGLRLNWSTLGYSVTPSLVAAVALLLKPTYGLMTLSIGLLYALASDLATAGFPLWYYALRKSLSTLAVSSLLVTLGSLVLH